MPSRIFGIDQSGFGLYFDLVGIFLVAFWITLIAWTYVDAKRRIEDPVLIMCATAASLYPYVGTIIYAILRPPDRLRDALERGLEIRAATLRLKQLEEEFCPSCEHPIEQRYLHCPNCRTRVKHPCRCCGKPVDYRWSLCPYCDETAPRIAPAHRRPASSLSTRLSPARRPARRQFIPARPARSPAPPGERAIDRPSAADARNGGSSDRWLL
jgi:hypothetical protein